ncbi:MAG: glycosyltransferase family 4 protein, partial [Chloroflexi bacterium]|nr:glycosyltransferase family 4 protein [Chloroflexota bacterium]
VVTVLTSRYSPALPAHETLGGVQVVRAPVVARLSKGVLMPTLGLLATRLAATHDAVSLHLPQFDASGIALRGRLFRKPTVLTYHCDLLLPPSPLNGLINRIVYFSNQLAATLADAIVAYTRDYAENSPLLSRYLSKVRVIPPPVEIAEVEAGAVAEFRARHMLNGHRVIGMAARLAGEKGVEHLLDALPTILDRHPETRVLFAGQYQNVLGEEKYARRLAPLFESYRDRWTFLGVLDAAQMAAFFRALDVLVVPSTNSTESFGLVQIESMLCGTPVVASNLPGVRQPVAMTGMGKVVPIADPPALADAVSAVLADRDSFRQSPENIAATFSPEAVAGEYERLFRELSRRKHWLYK